jgi:PIN domain nuclease of toxin-antitoxin system
VQARACLALSLQAKALVLTTDRQWLKLDVGESKPCAECSPD